MTDPRHCFSVYAVKDMSVSHYGKDQWDQEDAEQLYNERKDGDGDMYDDDDFDIVDDEDDDEFFDDDEDEDEDGGRRDGGSLQRNDEGDLDEEENPAGDTSNDGETEFTAESSVTVWETTEESFEDNSE